MDACDRIGILVIDETFDQWRIQKNPLDYHLYFEKWWQHDTRAMVLRDRNHPCIYCWSIGNEIPELFGVSDGAYWTKVQADYVRSLDPTRPVTAAAHGFYPPDPGTTPEPRDIKQTLISQGKPTGGLPKDDRDPWGEKTKAPFDALDIAGYNYMYGRYAYDKEKFPERVIHGTETHSFHTYDYWQATMENVNVIGDFIWTAYDNLGEAGAGRAIYDLDGNRYGVSLVIGPGSAASREIMTSAVTAGPNPITGRSCGAWTMVFICSPPTQTGPENPSTEWDGIGSMSSGIGPLPRNMSANPSRYRPMPIAMKLSLSSTAKA